MATFFIFLSIIFGIIKISDENENFTFNSEESRLVYDLFTGRNYNSRVRPVANYSTVLDLRVALQILSIVDLDLKEEILVTNVWLTMIWVDEFLTWDPKDYGDVTVLFLPSDQIWKPDLKLINNVLDVKEREMTVILSFRHNGEIAYIPPKQLRSECDLDVSYFPFDTQRCEMIFHTWAYTEDHVHLKFSESNEELMAKMVVNEFRPGVFNISNVIVKHVCETYYTGAVEGNYTYCKLIFRIDIKRRTLHYIYTVISPCALISLLSLLVFRLSPESGEKISLGITLLLVFHVLLWSLGEKMPESANTIPLLALYLTCIMTMTCLSIVVSVIVLNLHEKGNVKEVPHWVRYLILDKLAGLLHFKRARSLLKRNVNKDEKIQMVVEQLIDEVLGNVDTTNEEAPLLDDKKANVSKLLRLIVLKGELEKCQEDTAEEWRLVALVIDKLLFWIFSFITVVITVYMLIVIPLTT